MMVSGDLSWLGWAMEEGLRLSTAPLIIAPNLQPWALASLYDHHGRYQHPEEETYPHWPLWRKKTEGGGAQ